MAKAPVETKAKLDIVLPVVKIRVQDLSYLRGLLDAENAKDGRMKCLVPRGNDARLRMLGLIEDVEVGPCPDEIAEYNKLVTELKKVIRKATAGEIWDWTAIDQCGIYRVRSKPKPRIVMKVTAAGKKLLAQGSASVVVKKSC